MGIAEDAEGERVVELDPPTGASMIFVPSGFGDGSYPVYALRVSGNLVGLEIQFIAPDEPYPFRAATGVTGTDSKYERMVKNRLQLTRGQSAH